MRRASAFIAVYLALQVLLPLRYYTLQRDRHDERWAWRMFSPMRMVRCGFELRVDGMPVRLGRTFHEAWIRLAQRARGEIVDAMAMRVCRDNPGKAVRARLICRDVDGGEELIANGSWDACKLGSVR